MKEEILRVDRVTLRMDGVNVLHNVNLHIFAGEIMGLICVNTQGKKELIRLIVENTPLHYGMVYFREQLVNTYQYAVPGQNAVSVINKHGRLVQDLTVADNIFVLRRGFKKYIIKPETLNSQLLQFTQQLGIHIRGSQQVADLTPFEKIVVELLKAVVTGTRLVILQDLSNIISAADLSRFQELLRYYAKQGFSFLYVCSHHEESFSICDRVSMMENGQVLRVMEKEHFDESLVYSYCLDFSPLDGPVLPGGQNNAVLRFEGVHTAQLHSLSFAVNAGESVVLLDMSNNNFEDILRLLNGEARPREGSIFLNGKPLPRKRRSRTQDISFIQQSPLTSMLYPEMSYFDNLCFLVGEKSPLLWTNSSLKSSIEKEYRPLLGSDIYAEDIRRLSSRSLYNLVYYRVHLANPRVAVCVQPFFGADMYLRYHILQLMNVLRQKGIAVLQLAVNISDSLLLADRLLLVENGHLVAEYHKNDFEKFGRLQQYHPPISTYYGL